MILSQNKRIIKNITGITLLKLIDYIIPLLVIPYAIQKIGLNFYGQYAYYQTIAIYLAFISDYALPTVGVQTLSAKKKRMYIGSLTSSIIFTKSFFVLFVFSLIFLLNFIFFKSIFVYSMSMIFLGLGIQNIWYFQATENFKPAIIFSSLGRLISFFIMVVYVDGQSGKEYFLYAQGLMYLIPGLLCFSYILSNVKFNLPKWRYIKFILFKGWYVFQYRTLNASIIPFMNQLLFSFSDASLLAIYNIIIKGLSALINFINPLSLSVQPILSELQLKKEEFFKLFIATKNKILIISTLLSVILFFSVYLYIKYYSDIKLDTSLVLMMVLISLTIIPHAINGLFSQVLIIYNDSEYIRNKCLHMSIFIFISLPIGLFLHPAIFTGVINFVSYFGLSYSLLKRVKNEL